MSMLDLPDSVTFNFPTPILFGLGVRREIGSFLKEHGLSRPLIVTDEGIAPLPMLHDLKVLLEGDGLEPQVFSDMGGDGCTTTPRLPLARTGVAGGSTTGPRGVTVRRRGAPPPPREDAPPGRVCSISARPCSKAK